MKKLALAMAAVLALLSIAGCGTYVGKGKAPPPVAPDALVAGADQRPAMRTGHQAEPHERIYQIIWQCKRDGGDLWRGLRRRGKRYNKRGGKNAGRGLIRRPLSPAKPVWETGRAIPLSVPNTRAACSRWSSANPTGQNHQVAAGDRRRNTDSRRASPQANRRLRAHHHLRQRKGVRCASGHRPCPEGQNLLSHAIITHGSVA
jgi:predicted small lipoprotein YifL